MHKIHIEGPPLERGRMHGRLLREPIRAHLAVWEQAVRSNYAIGSDQLIAKFLSDTNFMAAISRWTPDLLDEISGIADGAGVQPEAIYTLNMLDEVWVRYGKAGIPLEHCSSIAWKGTSHSPAIVAQNMDIEAFRDGFQTLVHVTHATSNQEQLLVTFAGGIGLLGLNSLGLGLCVNSLLQLNSSIDGLPVACVVRGVLDQINASNAHDFLRMVRHATGQNYLFADQDGIYDVECSANKVVTIKNQDGSAGLWHTNHPLVNDDVSERFLNPTDTLRDAVTQRFTNSSTRLQSLEKTLGLIVNAGVDTIRRALTAKDSEQFPVCVGKSDPLLSFTFASTIMVLGKKPEMWIAPGPPDTTTSELVTIDSIR